MSALVTYFDPPPGPGELPARLPSPFDPGPPHPLARRAAAALQAALERGEPVSAAELAPPQRGKMFGVLVVADAAGRVGFLRGFSGMLGGTWHVPGFVPPVFEQAERDAWWIAGEAELGELDRRIAEVVDGPEARALAADEAAAAARQAAERSALAAAHATNRARRQDAREVLAAVDEAARQAGLAALAQASRADGTADKRLRAAHRTEREALAARRRELDARRAALEAARTARSRELLVRMFDGYRFADARGQVRTLRELFAPDEPPGGAGDCAAPKLFAHAHRHGLVPLALAEFWWGAPPVDEGRHHGVFYPACRGKCGPILPHVLGGVDAEPSPVFGSRRVAEGEPRTVFEDAWLAVVDKPAGLLSVPGRSGALRDSVAARLRVRYPDATGPLVVHRLDLDTSGLLLVAKDSKTHAALQTLFAVHAIEKRYAAILDGELAADEGLVDLPIRVDLDDRPRQLHDPVHGKPARTAWKVLSRAGGRTRVAFFPETGRTHQLRVHAAHPLGLNVPIVGDRLYGRAERRGEERLMLHAEALSFVHPRTGETLRIERPAPF